MIGYTEKRMANDRLCSYLNPATTRSNVSGRNLLCTCDISGVFDPVTDAIVAVGDFVTAMFSVTAREVGPTDVVDADTAPGSENPFFKQ
jgi:hypothetical protein